MKFNVGDMVTRKLGQKLPEWEDNEPRLILSVSPHITVDDVYYRGELYGHDPRCLQLAEPEPVKEVFGNMCLGDANSAAEIAKRTTQTEATDVPSNAVFGNPKYDRTIHGKFGTGSCNVDVYRVLDAFDVTNPQLQHLIKKALCAGLRGHKDTRQDLVDILHSAQSALDMFDDKESKDV